MGKGSGDQCGRQPVTFTEAEPAVSVHVVLARIGSQEPGRMTVEQAEMIARAAHHGVRDRHDLPYIEHVRRVAGAVSARARRVAWLHDVVEDTDVTLDQLRVAGLSDDEVQALRMVTRDKSDGLTYMNWIRTIAAADGEAGVIAREVKHEDNQDNLSRPDEPGREGAKDRYRRSERILRAARQERGELAAA